MIDKSLVGKQFGFNATLENWQREWITVRLVCLRRSPSHSELKGLY